MAEQFLHGIETIEVDDGIRPVRTLKSAVIGLIGTAPDADVSKYPYNEPILIVGNPRQAADLGEAGTLKDALDRIFEQGGATVIVVRVEEGSTDAETRGNIVGSPTSGTGVWAFLQARSKVGLSPRILIAPGWTSYRVTDGVTDVSMVLQGSGYTEAPTITFNPAPGSEVTATGTATLTSDKVTAVSITNDGAGYLTAPTVTFSAPPAGAGNRAASAVAILGTGDKADEVVGVVVTDGGVGYVAPPTVTFSAPPPPTPKITPTFTALLGSGADVGKVIEVRVENPGEGVAPGSTITIAAPTAGTQATATLQLGSAKNPVVAAMQSIASRVRAVIFADGPSTTDQAAVTYRGDYGDKRLWIVDPKVTVFDKDTNSHVAYPTSASAAGVQARVDKDRGFWWSLSNQELFGITGTSRPIDFNISDPDTQANWLNENEVATVIRHEGYRLWGNRTTSADPLWAFLSVRRTADMIYESLEEAFLWAIDRPFSVNNIIEIAESVNAYLRHLTAVGAILGGKCWIDPTLNTKDQLMQGKLYVDFDIEPPAPLEHLIFRAHRNGDYYEELIDTVIRKMSV
jgi:phage tail sheath protein FI